MKIGEHSLEFYALDAAEYAQAGINAAIGAKLGAKVITPLTGADSPAYTQLQFIPRRRIIHHDLNRVVQTPKAAAKTLPVSRLKTCSVISANSEELDCLQDSMPSSVEAVMYMSEGVPRVGIMAVKGSLLGALKEGRKAVAMREGGEVGHMNIGRWDPRYRQYIGARSTTLHAAGVEIKHQLPALYSGIRLG